MEEFLFVLHDLSTRKFYLDIACQQNAAVELDGDVIVNALQIRQLVWVNLQAIKFSLITNSEIAKTLYLWPRSDDRISERSKSSNRRKIVQLNFANLEKRKIFLETNFSRTSRRRYSHSLRLSRMACWTSTNSNNIPRSGVGMVSWLLSY